MVKGGLKANPLALLKMWSQEFVFQQQFQPHGHPAELLVPASKIMRVIKQLYMCIWY